MIQDMPCSTAWKATIQKLNYVRGLAARRGLTVTVPRIRISRGAQLEGQRNERCVYKRGEMDKFEGPCIELCILPPILAMLSSWRACSQWLTCPGTRRCEAASRHLHPRITDGTTWMPRSGTVATHVLPIDIRLATEQTLHQLRMTRLVSRTAPCQQ